MSVKGKVSVRSGTKGKVKPSSSGGSVRGTIKKKE